MFHAFQMPTLARLLVLSLLALAGIGAGARPVAAQFTIDELELHFTPDGSGALTGVIPLHSVIDSAQQVQVTIRDWERDSLGNNRFLEYGANPRSCQGKLEVFPLTLQLAPRATEYIRVTYTGRDLPDPGCWSVVLTERVRPPAQQVQGASVSLTVVTGVKVYVHATAATASGDVVSADVEAGWTRADAARDSVFVRQVALRFANTGTAHLRVRSTLEIRDETTQLVERIVGPEAYITPDAFRDILIRLPALRRGRYVGVVLLDYGAEEITAAQVEFEIP